MLRWKAELLPIPSEILANEARRTPPAVHRPTTAFPPPSPPVQVLLLNYAWLSTDAGPGTV